MWQALAQLGLVYQEDKPVTDTEKLLFWVACQKDKHEDDEDAGPEDDGRRPVDRETAAFITWAWRCLYAEVTNAHIETHDFDPKQALRMTIRMSYSRVKAYGHKWRKWYLKQRLWREETTKLVPEEHQEYTCISCDPEAKYTISKALVSLYDREVRGARLRSNDQQHPT